MSISDLKVAYKPLLTLNLMGRGGGRKGSCGGCARLQAEP